MSRALVDYAGESEDESESEMLNQVVDILGQVKRKIDILGSPNKKSK